MKKYFTEEDIWIAHEKIWSTTLAIREMQIKTMLRYYYTSNRTAKIKNSDNTKC